MKIETKPVPLRSWDKYAKDSQKAQELDGTATTRFCVSRLCFSATTVGRMYVDLSTPALRCLFSMYSSLRQTSDI